MRAKTRKPYTSDLSDEEWNRIKPLVKADKHFGLKSRTKFSRREMLNAIFYVLRTGCQWRDLPNDLPPWSAVYMQFDRWKKKGLFIKNARSPSSNTTRGSRKECRSVRRYC